MRFARLLPRQLQGPLLWAAPALVLLFAFYWHGLTSWFQVDDFAWMSQWRDVHSARDLLTALFAPRAQGSIRPISERAFFLGIQAIFGWNPVPFRAVAFLTQSAGLMLLASISLRLTGSKVAAVLAPIFWMASSALAVPMMWSSVYNQILCAALFLAAFRCWIAYCDGDGSRWYVAQWAIFLCGFGVLETMVMYPVLALSWPAGWRRWKQLVPLFAASAGYTLLHQSVSPAPKAGVYALHADTSMVFTLATYLKQVFGGPMLAFLPGEWLLPIGLAAPVLVGVPLAVFACWRRDARLAVPFAFLLAPLIPMLPLRDHVMHYYLVMPAAGLAMLLAWCCAVMAQRRISGRLAALAMAVVFLVPSLAVARRYRDFWYERGQGVRTLMLGLVGARERHPESVILLTGVDGTRFYASLASDALRAFDLKDVYLTPDSHLNIDPEPGEPDVKLYELPEAVLRTGLASGSILVYASAGDRLRNITTSYRTVHRLAAGSTDVAERVEPASPLYAGQLGEGWLGPGGAARWIGLRAVATIRAVQAEKLVVEGYVPPVQFSLGPFGLRPVVNGTQLEQATITAPGVFHLEFALPRNIVGTEKWEITLVVDHVVLLSDGSHASLLISSIFSR